MGREEIGREREVRLGGTVAMQYGIHPGQPIDLRLNVGHQTSDSAVSIC